MSGRLVHDNVILAYETINTIQHCNLGKKGTTDIKLDISKVYKQVELPYILGVIKGWASIPSG